MIEKGQDPKEMLIEVCKVKKIISLHALIGNKDYKNVRL